MPQSIFTGMQDLKAPGHVPYFVKRVVSVALDRHDR